MLAPETLIHGRYRIEALIGQGGMGAVYRAVDERLRSRVALKQTTVAGEQLSAAFEREAQILAGLRHPGLPRVIDHFSEPAGQFLVMEYIEGQDLAALMRERAGPFAPAEVLGWAGQILAALEYLHGRQPPIIHRDIKPQNLKLTPQGELVLLDFGLAKGSAALASAAASPGPSLFGYTPQYAPLEQVQGSGTGPRSDIYSLGATLYHLLTGAMPADVLSRADAVLNGRPDPLAPADRLRPDLPASLAGALAQATALRADERFASAAAMARALAAVTADLPASATGTTVVAPPRRPQVGASENYVKPAPAPGDLPRETLPPAPRAARPGPERYGPSPMLVGGLAVLVVGALLIGFLALNRPGPAGPAAAPATAGPGLPAGEPISLDAVIEGEIASPGQTNVYRFSAAADQQIFVWTAGFDDGMSQIDLRLLGPGGDELPGAGICLGCGNLGAVTLRRAGEYALVVGSNRDPATGRYELRLSAVPPPADYSIGLEARIGAGQPDASAGDILKPGARQVYRFSAAADQQIFVWTAGFDDGMSQIGLRLLGPGGDELPGTSTCLGCGNLGVVTLRRAGEYALVVGSDHDPATGRYELRLSAVPPPTVSDVGLPFLAEAAIAAPGARQVYRFSAAAGQQIFVTTRGFDDGMSQVGLRLLGPGGDELPGTSTCLGCGNLGAVTLREAGEYALVVGSDRDPATGNFQVEVTLPGS